MRARATQLLALSPLLAACGPGIGGVGIDSLEAELSSEVNTVVEISWHSQLAGDAWVEFGLSEALGRSTPLLEHDGFDHRAELLGLPPHRTVYFEVFTDTGDRLLSQRGEVVTAGLPPGLPELEPLLHDPSALSPEPYLLMSLLGEEPWVVVSDRSGEILWYRSIPKGQERALPTSVAFDPSTGGVIVGRFFMDFMMLATDENPEHSQAMRFDMAGEELSLHDLGVAHHELLQLPDGSFATMGIDRRPWYDEARGEDVQVMGDTLVLVDPDGQRREIFSTWDWAEPEVHGRFYQVCDETGDWTHGNGLAYDPDSDSFLMSLGLMGTVLEIDRQSGRVLREFGPGGWAVEEGMPFVYQHDPHWTEEGTLLMSSSVGQESRLMAIEYEVDEQAGALRELWSYGEHEGFISIAGGQALRMDNGNTLLNTGYGGLMVEVSPEGEPVWEMITAMGHVFASVSFFDDFYDHDGGVTAR
jgi:hypothetical protein